MIIVYSVQEIRATPTLVYVRLTYAVVILIKLAISTSTTELGTVLNHEDIKVSFYLEKLLVRLKAVAALDDQAVHTLGDRFYQILAKVKIWFQQQMKPPKPAHEFKAPAASFELSGRTEPKHENLSQDADKFSFMTDFGKSTNMYNTSWPDQFQPTTDYSDPNDAGQPSWNDVAFDFPMDLDPNLFTHLIEADQDQNLPDNGPSNVEGYDQMNYLGNAPNFGGWPMQ